MARVDAMVKSVHAKNSQFFFYKNVSKSYKKGKPNASNVNGANDSAAIFPM